MTLEKLNLTSVCALLVFAVGSTSAPPQDRNSGLSASSNQDQQISRLPHQTGDGANLPNGWHVTPAGKAIATLGDLVTNLTVSPDGKVIVAVNSGYVPHALTVFDARTHKQLQRIPLSFAWLGMTWSSDGCALYVSGGTTPGSAGNSNQAPPIYEFNYANGHLSEKPFSEFVERVNPKQVWWSGIAYLSKKHWLYVANRGTGPGASNVVVFDARTREIVTRIPVETTPYQTVLTADGRYLFVSNESSESVSVIDTRANRVISTIRVGMNPNDMKLSSDGRLFVACSNDNTVYVIDTRTLQVVERLSTALTPMAPEGSTPDALAIDDMRKLLYVADADNNSIMVADISNRKHASIIGFIPTGWYPSALALADRGGTLYIGNAKGETGHPDPEGPTASWPSDHRAEQSVRTLQTSSIEILPVVAIKAKLPHWTHQVMENTPYNDSMLSEARAPQEPSVIPQRVGAWSPIQHIIYIIKENRTYDQVFGDLPGANGDPKLTLFGGNVTPNLHALAKEYVTLDNLYCDGEVSVDGHSWSDSAYATDFNEKQWPAQYGGHSSYSEAAYDVRANVPSGGRVWDIAKRKGLTYRSYGEFAARASTGTGMYAAPGLEGLMGHVSPGAIGGDETRLKVFLNELKEYEANYDSPDPSKRFPNLVVMSMPGDHTQGTTPGALTPSAFVAKNDYVIGQLVDAVSHSRYWPNTAIFIIEDDAQDGADHVDARRTEGLVISPYVRRGIVDSTLYSTSSMLRSIELLLGLPAMSQYDAAAMPMYASFGTTPVVTAFTAIHPLIDINEKNTPKSYGAAASSKMDFTVPDRAPMHALNEIIWKSVKGIDSVMPAPVHRFRPLVDPAERGESDEN